jgi:aminopeptidase N
MTGAADGSRWQVPLVMRHGERSETLLLAAAQQSVTLPGCPALPLLLNPGGEGFYRVAYAPAQHAALALAFDRLPPSARITLLSDTFALAQAGQTTMAAYLDLLAALPRVQGADKSAAWSSTRSTLAFLDNALIGTPARAPLHAAARALLAPQLAALGWAPPPGEDSETEALRGNLIAELARYGDTATVARAQALFDADEAGRTPLPAALRASVIRAVARHADAARFKQLVARLKASPHEDDHWLYATSLAGVEDADLARQVLAMSLDGSLPPNIASRLPGMVAGNPAHGELAYRFTLEHWAALSDLAGTMFGARSWLLPAAAEGFNRPEDAQRLLRDQQRLLGETGTANAERIAAQITLLAAVQAREAERLREPLRSLAAGLPRQP